MALVDDERLAEPGRVDLVGAQQVDQLDFAALGAGEDAFDVAPALARHEAEIERTDPRGRPVQHVEPVPTVFRHAEAFGDGAGGSDDSRPVGACEGPLAQHDHRLFRRVQDGAESVPAFGDVGQDRGVVAETVVAIGQIDRLPDQADRETAHRVALAEPRIDKRRFPARIGADDEAGIGVFDPRDGGVEQVARARAGG